MAAAAVIVDFLAALERRRATGETAAATEVAAACTRQLASWGARRLLVPDDPLVERLGVLDAALEAGVAVLRWPVERGWRDLLGLDDAPATCALTIPAHAVAERGTLVLESSPAHGRSPDAVGWWHLAVLDEARIVPTLAEALRATYADRPPPSGVSLVSGPSRTSDVEKITTYGAHGALAEHVVIVTAPSPAVRPPA